jgi:hypothetical protein
MHQFMLSTITKGVQVKLDPSALPDAFSSGLRKLRSVGEYPHDAFSMESLIVPYISHTIELTKTLLEACSSDGVERQIVLPVLKSVISVFRAIGNHPGIALIVPNIQQQIFDCFGVALNTIADTPTGFLINRLNKIAPDAGAGDAIFSEFESVFHVLQQADHMIVSSAAGHQLFSKAYSGVLLHGQSSVLDSITMDRLKKHISHAALEFAHGRGDHADAVAKFDTARGFGFDMIALNAERGFFLDRDAALDQFIIVVVDCITQIKKR